MLRTLVIAVAIGAASGQLGAQSAPPRLPPDLLPAIQMTQLLVAELKRVCITKYPELSDEIERAHKEWVLFPVKISILVNGKEYLSPPLQASLDLARSQFTKQDEQRTRRDCEDFRSGLNRMLERVPREALQPFLP